MPRITIPPGIEGIVGIVELPDQAWRDRWERIFVPDELKNRVLNYMVFSLRHRRRLRGRPRANPRPASYWPGRQGRARRRSPAGSRTAAARDLGDSPMLFVDINPHAFPSQLLGESQRSVARLFERTLPDLARRGPADGRAARRGGIARRQPNRSLARDEPGRRPPGDRAVLAGIDQVARRNPAPT